MTCYLVRKPNDGIFVWFSIVTVHLRTMLLPHHSVTTSPNVQPCYDIFRQNAKQRKMLFNKFVVYLWILLFVIKYSVKQIESPLNQNAQVAYRIRKKYFPDRIMENFLDTRYHLRENLKQENLDIQHSTDTAFVYYLIVLKHCGSARQNSTVP